MFSKTVRGNSFSPPLTPAVLITVKSNYEFDVVLNYEANILLICVLWEKAGIS